MRKQTSKVNMDTKQRICLTRILSKEERENLSSFRIYREQDKIILEPLVEIPAKDHWLYKNPKAMAKLLQGMEDIKEGKISSLGSFSKYATEEDSH